MTKEGRKNLVIKWKSLDYDIKKLIKKQTEVEHELITVYAPHKRLNIILYRDYIYNIRHIFLEQHTLDSFRYCIHRLNKDLTINKNHIYKWVSLKFDEKFNTIQNHE